MLRTTLARRALPFLVPVLIMAGAVPASASTDTADDVAETIVDAAAEAGVPAVSVAPTVLEGDALVATTSASPAEVAAAVDTAVGDAEAAAEDAGLTQEETAVITALVAEAAADDATAPITVELPVDPSGAVTVDASSTAGTEVTFGLPTTEAHRNATVAEDGTVLYEDGTGAVDVAAQPARDGSVRVHTVLNGPEAPTEFPYALGLAEGVSPTLSADGGVDMLRSVTYTDAESGEQQVEQVSVGRVAPAWAVDANGTAVPTRYELREGALVQVVEHTAGDYAYPITADPWWSTAWNIARCAAAVAFVALTAVFVAFKAAAIVRAVNAARLWVKSVGGATEAAKLLTAANSAEKTRAIAAARKVAGTAVLDFFGITQIREACF